MKLTARVPMRPCPAALAAAVLACLLIVPDFAPRAQEVTTEIKERSDSLDVPFVPSHSNVLETMFAYAKPTRDDFLIDLGSGDGRIVINAARRFGTTGFGVDLNAALVDIANGRARSAGVADRARFYVRDLFKTSIGQASILTMYLLPEIVQELRPKIIAEMKPGSRIVSHDYHLGSWRPDAAKVVDIGSKSEESIVYYWVVPARVAGEWRWEMYFPAYFDNVIDYSASISQDFQDFGGKLDFELQPVRILNPNLTGKRIAFSAAGEIDERIVRHDFEGVVEGDRIVGTMRLSGGVRDVVLPWRAQRIKAAE